MTRKFASLFVIMLLLVAVSAVSSFASMKTDAKITAMKRYASLQGIDDDSFNASAKNTPATSLGAFSADGGSPGYITGRTYNDRQNWFHPGKTVAWGNSPNVHFVFGAQVFSGDDETVSAKWVEYTMFDPTVAPQGVWRSPVMIHTDPFIYNGKYQQVTVDETGHALPAAMVSSPSNAELVINSEIYWDVSGPGAYGTFVGDTLPQSISMNEIAVMAYPRVLHQEYNGTYTTHIATYENIVPAGWVTYYRRVGANPTIGGWETTRISGEVSWDILFTIACSQGDGPEGNKVAIAWLRNEGAGPGEDDDDNVAFVESTDGGLTWPTLETPTTIINIVSEPGTGDWLPNAEVDAMYDTEGYLHLAYNATQIIDGTSQGIDPARVYHWTNRVAGPNGGGTLSLVHIADFNGLGPMCGRAGGNRQNVSNVAVSQCNDRLYMTWQQFGDYTVGDTADCPVENEFIGGYNADLYMSVSLGNDGSLWDRGRNLTNSKTPGCDSTVANSCDHDNYMSPVRQGMDVSAMGTTYWTAVPEAYEVRDVLQASYPDDGWYIDVHYINDLYPEAALWMDGDPIWSYNPMKWFRMPCVDPVIEPAIAVSIPDFLSPTNWVKAGTATNVAHTEIQNIGNDILNISSITANVTAGNAGWISIASIPATVAAGGTESFDVTLNPGGVVTTQELLVADIVIGSDDPNTPTLTALSINTVIADTVVQIAWDTVQTDAGFGLTASNHGNAGNSGDGLVNLDFVYTDSTGPDCDSSQDEHLYDLTPIIMYDGSGADGTYSWSPFWTPQRAASFNFVPVAGDVEPILCDGDGFEQYRTSTFVTSDSALGCVKHWVAPNDDVSFVIEKWEIFSYDGSTVSGARFGEWIDWDTPSGTDGNEGGFVASSGSVDYVYQQGIVDPAGTPCLAEDRRFGGSGLLGYYSSSEKTADASINHTGLFGGFVHQDDDLFEDGADRLITDSVWAWLGRDVWSANNSSTEEDQQVLLSFGSFDVTPGDTLVFWTVHATVYDGDTDALQGVMDAAEAWYLANRDLVGVCFSGCCGKFSDGTWLTGYTGNTNCSDDGKRTLSDITKLIDNVYISKEPLCCYASGNTNGSWDDGECKITLSDITKLIDAVYISKEPTEACVSGCER